MDVLRLQRLGPDLRLSSFQTVSTPPGASGLGRPLFPPHWRHYHPESQLRLPRRERGPPGPGPSTARTARGAGAKGTGGTRGLGTRPSRRGQAATQGCSWALGGRGRSGSKFTGRATHTAHQGCWTVPGARTALALGPDSEHSTIWPPSGRMRGGKE